MSTAGAGWHRHSGRQVSGATVGCPAAGEWRFRFGLLSNEPEGHAVRRADQPLVPIMINEVLTDDVVGLRSGYHWWLSPSEMGFPLGAANAFVFLSAAAIVPPDSVQPSRFVPNFIVSNRETVDRRLYLSYFLTLVKILKLESKLNPRRRNRTIASPS